jgi:hypothetical protein
MDEVNGNGKRLPKLREILRRQKQDSEVFNFFFLPRGISPAKITSKHRLPVPGEGKTSVLNFFSRTYETQKLKKNFLVLQYAKI